MGKNNIRIGVIGVGHLGEYHVQKYVAIPKVDLVGVVDIDHERARDIARRYNTQAFAGVEEILGEVDGVSLAVPTESHFHMGRDILSRGVHLLIEKPITYKLSHADQLIELAEEKGVVLQVGHVERFNPAVIRMESLLNRPIFIESNRLNLFTNRGIDVDVVLDLMIHDLDIILHAVNSEIREVHAVGLSVITEKTDIANVRIIFGNGTVANLTASRVSNKNLRKIRIFQTDSYMSVDCVKRQISVTRLNGHMRGPDKFPQITSEKLKYPDSDPLADQIGSFVETIVTSSEPVVTGDDGRKALRVALAIIEQIESGCMSFRAIC
jgi:predicted dehydrogenase